MRLKEFAPDSNDDSGEEDILHKYARMWWVGDEATQLKIEAALNRMGWEIGEDEGGYDNGGVFVVRAGDVNGNSYQSWAAEDLTEGLTEVDRRGFLKGLGAAAVAGAAGGANADQSGRIAGLRAKLAREVGVLDVDSKNYDRVGGSPKLFLFANDGSNFVMQWIDKEGNDLGDPIFFGGGKQGTDNQGNQIIMFFGPKIAVKITPGNDTDRIYITPRSWIENKIGWQSVYAEVPNIFSMMKRESVEQGVAEGSEDPFGPQGRFVGDTGPAQVTTTVPRHKFRAGDRVMYKPTGARATIENLYKDGTVARIHVASGMGGQYFDAKVADLKALGQGPLREKSTSQAQFRTMAAAAHDPKFARKVGIKPSVAKEFNKADKGQSYKSLPKKAD